MAGASASGYRCAWDPGLTPFPCQAKRDAMKASKDGDVDWDGCTAEGFVALPETFKQAHARYSAAYQAVVDGPRTQTYYGGVSCRVLDQVQARLTNEKHMIEFTGTKLGMSGQEKEPCDVLKARLDALDKAAAAQGS